MAIQTSVSDAPAVGFAGLLVGQSNVIWPMKNAHATASIGFGYGVVFKASPATDQDATLPGAETDKIAGIVVLADVYDRTYTLADGTTAGELDGTGLKPGAMMNILRKGKIWARCEDGCAPGDRLWVRNTVGSPAGTEFLGSLNNADEGTEMIDCTGQGVWLTTAAAEGLAILEVDFTADP